MSELVFNLDGLTDELFECSVVFKLGRTGVGYTIIDDDQSDELRIVLDHGDGAGKVTNWVRWYNNCSKKDNIYSYVVPNG